MSPAHPLVEEAPFGIFEADETGQFLEVNSALCDAVGYDRDALLGTSITDLQPSGGDFEQLLDPSEMQRGDHTRTETTFRHGDGAEVDVLLDVVPVDDRVAGYVREVTGRTERERDLLATKERMELALEGANLGIWDWNMRTDEVTRDELLTEMLGYTNSEMGDRMAGWEEVVHPDDEARHHEALEDHVTNRTPYYRCDHRLQTKSGDWKWVRTMGKVVERADDGTPVRAVGLHQDIDDQKRAKLQLEEERAMFASGPTVVFKWGDAAGWPIEYVSENVEDILGYTPAELQSGAVSFSDIVLDDVDRTPGAASETGAPGTDHAGPDPYRIRTADGDVRWVMEYTGHGSDGSHLLGYLVDVTERKESEEKYRHLFEDTRDALMLLDRDGFFDCNERALDLFCVESVDAFVDLAPWELSPDTQPDGTDSKDAARAHIETAFEEGEAFFEWTHARVDGSEFPAEVKLSKFQTGGEPAIHALVRDITERKAYEHAIERARETLRQVIDLIPDPIFVKNGADELLLTNEAYAELLGLTRDAIEGRPESELFPDTAHYERLRQRDLDVIDSGQATVFEEELTNASGETRIFQTTRIPFEAAETAEDAVLGYARDVTDLKEYEAELETQRDNLEVLNQVVRHDIRNDLQLVLAYADILRTDVEDADRTYVDQVLDAARDAVDITTTARDVTKVMLHSDVERHPVRLRSVLENELEDVRSNYDSALVTLEGSVPPVAVLADDMLASVFRNLLTNAILHNDADVPEVTTSARQVDGSVRVRIADNGPGIPDRRKEDIFDQGEMGLDSEGTGVGLYLVDTLVDRYGGDVRVEDNQPRGAAFIVELPVAGDSWTDVNP